MDLSILRGMASQKLYQHKLFGWSFNIVDVCRRLGVCKHGKQRIEIQEYYALNNPPEIVVDTLMHEIAHALTPGHHHNSFWKSVAIQLGAQPVSCKKRTDIQLKPGNWKATCDECGKVYYKYKNSPGLENRRFGCLVCKNMIAFEWAGDPADKPKAISMWQAQCPCGTHKKVKRPIRRTYHCRRCKTTLVWMRP